MLAFVMPPRRLKTLVSILLGVVLFGAAWLWMGATKPGAQFLGVQLSRPTPVQPAEAWTDALKQIAADKGLTNWTVQPWAEYGFSERKREAYYRATLQGVRDGENVTVKVELRAPHGGEWRVKEWSEQ